MKKILFIFIVFILAIFGVQKENTAYAQNQSSQAFAKYNISFPVKDLGDCGSPLACKTFCDDPLNHQTCIDFAKKKGFYKGEEYRQKRAIALSNAQQNLDCDSEEACRQACAQPENQDKCSAFAQRFALKGGVIVNPQSSTILQKAQTVLGCTSYESCKQFCSQEENKTKCDTFAKTAGISGGTVKEGPGKCTTQESCQTYCSDPNNFNECQSFVKESGVAPSGSPSFTGPGGCNSEASCRDYCQKNPSDCQNFSKQNQPINQNTSSNPPPGQTQPNFQQAPQDPATYCKQTTGCSWTGTTCQCSQSPFPTQGVQPNISPSATSGNQSNSNNTSPTQIVNCTGPDGKQFQATQQDCDNFNKSWGKTSSSTNTSSSGFNQQTYTNLGTSGSLVDCTGPDGGHFKATQQQCDYAQSQWKSAQSSGSSGGSSSGSSGGSSGQSGATSSHTGSCDTSCQQSMCSQYGGTWVDGTCKPH